MSQPAVQLDLFGESTAEERDREVELAEEGLRKVAGAYYTPDDVVDRLLGIVLDPLIAERERDCDALARLVVLDPACGSGNFLLAAAGRIAAALCRAGVPEAESNRIAHGHCVVGVDLDREATTICIDRLRAAGGRTLAPRVWHADALLLPLHDGNTLFATDVVTSWDRVLNGDDGFDVVIGNPPFLSQLSSATSRRADYTKSLVERFGDVVGGYADPAAIFLLLATQLARMDGGVACLIQPVSVLATRDAAPLRAAILADTRITGMWIAGDRIFDAAVDVSAPVLARVADPPPITVWSGREVNEVATASPSSVTAGTWSALLAIASGVPAFEVPKQDAVFGDEVRATADFRDQYYGLAPHTVDKRDADESEWPRLVTAGLIDPAANYWGTKPTKFNKRNFDCPRVSLSSLEPPLREWANKRLVPKILVATQTKVLEAWVDQDGAVLPSVPVITVETAPERLWHVAAALSSPPVTLVAMQRHLGSGMSATALKLSARELSALPLPAPSAAWDEAARLFEAASAADDDRIPLLIRSGRAMCDAYGVDNVDELMAWWEPRLATRR